MQSLQQQAVRICSAVFEASQSEVRTAVQSALRVLPSSKQRFELSEMIRRGGAVDRQTACHLISRALDVPLETLPEVVDPDLPSRITQFLFGGYLFTASVETSDPRRLDVVIQPHGKDRGEDECVVAPCFHWTWIKRSNISTTHWIVGFPSCVSVLEPPQRMGTGSMLCALAAALNDVSGVEVGGIDDYAHITVTLDADVVRSLKLAGPTGQVQLSPMLVLMRGSQLSFYSRCGFYLGDEYRDQFVKSLQHIQSQNVRKIKWNWRAMDRKTRRLVEKFRERSVGDLFIATAGDAQRYAAVALHLFGNVGLGQIGPGDTPRCSLFATPLAPAGDVKMLDAWRKLNTAIIEGYEWMRM